MKFAIASILAAYAAASYGYGNGYYNGRIHGGRPSGYNYAQKDHGHGFNTYLGD